MGTFNFKQGYYYMVGVDKPPIISMDTIVDQVEKQGFIVHLVDECEKWGNHGQMPFLTGGASCPNDYDWTALAERIGPTTVLDVPDQVKWIKEFPKPDPNQQPAPGPTPGAVSGKDIEMYTMRMDWVSEPKEEPDDLFIGWFYGPPGYGQVIVDRASLLRMAGHPHVWEVTTGNQAGWWNTFKEWIKGLFGSSRWYDVFLIPPGMAIDPATMMHTRVHIGQLWTDSDGANDFVCDLGGTEPPIEPRFILWDRENERWYFSPFELPLLYDSDGPYGKAGIAAGRTCRR